VTLSESTSSTATLGGLAAGAALERRGLDATTDSGTAAGTAIELMRKQRLFIRDSILRPQVAISIHFRPVV
jgi:hypothetical protein